MRTRLCVLATIAIALPSAICAEDWPAFRGPTGQGTSTEKDLPIKWNHSENVAWKVEVPGEGWSSPIVLGERVFITACTDDGQSCRVLAYARGDGKLLWNLEVFRQTKSHKNEKNSYASSTPVTDGRQVYAAFGDGSLAAVSVQGQTAWVNREVQHYSEHGLGTSPILYGNLVIMAYDGSSARPDKALGWQKPWDGAFLRAVDRVTGKEVWRTKRGSSRIAHTTPLVVNLNGRDELISAAGDVIQGFEPNSGELQWTVPAEGEGVVPSPILADGLVVAASGFGKPRLRAVRVSPTDSSKEHVIAWTAERHVPMVPSAVYVDKRLIVVTENGIASCLEAQTGKVIFTERLGGTYSASLTTADGMIYALSEQGETAVFRASPRFELISRNAIKEQCQASMAIAQRQLFIRSARHLFCIGSASQY